MRNKLESDFATLGRGLADNLINVRFRATGSTMSHLPPVVPGEYSQEQGFHWGLACPDGLRISSSPSLREATPRLTRDLMVMQTTS